ncbi:MAG: 4a-hydroxytetrahydrobiopterin dehydratase [Verrucomicrobiota bacterium]|nr:4a-hydroxytetrahydrobiopterin dehydratase [Verrucomicrobiota bacterium]
MSVYSKKKTAQALEKIPGWKLNGSSISRTFVFEDFIAAMGFVTQVAILAEKAFHHPDINIRWNKVTITLSTHDVSGLTKKDFDLAGKLQVL